MSEIRVGRLRRLAKHLRSKHLVHKKFNIMELAEGKLDKKGNYCGSAGCAMGEFPAVWPEEWDWKHLNNVSVIHVVYKGAKKFHENDVYNFFSITESHAHHLFYSSYQNTELYGGKKLDDDATAIEVADNIDAFIKKVS